MENKNNSNEISIKPFFSFKKSKKNVEKPKIKNVKNLFMTKTFASKLFIKLCSQVIDPIIICLQTLKYEPENRKQEEIESTIPYLKTLEYFNDYVNYLEDPKSAFDLMTKFARITFYQYHRKDSIIKRPGDTNDTFFILLNGNIYKYNLIFEVENLTLEQYLLYLVELEIINEKEVINKCFLLNKDIIKVNSDYDGTFNVEKLVNNSNKFNYNEMLKRAESDLIKLGFNASLYKKGKLRLVPSISNYLQIFENVVKPFDEEGKNKFHFYVGKYKLCTKLIKGQFFNDISEINLKENNLYLCETNCDLGQIKKEEFIKNELNILINNKMKKLFSQIKNNFFILREIENEKFWNNYANCFLYKKFKKGDKIFFQGGYFTGMYLILEGNISLTTSSSIDKLSNLLFTIVNSIKSFSEYIPSFNSESIIQEFNNMNQLLYRSIKLTHAEYLQKRKIDISTQKKFEIIGFYELINNKTELYNFTAECISSSAILLFIPRNNLNLILGKELNFYKSLIYLVENKIQYIVGKFKSFVQRMINNYKMSLTSGQKIKFNKTKNNKFNSSGNINSRNTHTQHLKRFSMDNNYFNKLKNDNEKKSDIIYNYNNQKYYNYYESLNNFKKELVKKKKINDEIALNKKNNLFIQSKYDKFFIPKNLKINVNNTKPHNNDFFATHRNNFFRKENKALNHKSVNLSLNNKKHYNSYFTVNTIGANYDDNNSHYYETKIKNYHVFPMINEQRKKFIYK